MPLSGVLLYGDYRCFYLDGFVFAQDGGVLKRFPKRRARVSVQHSSNGGLPIQPEFTRRKKSTARRTKNKASKRAGERGSKNAKAYV